MGSARERRGRVASAGWALVLAGALAGPGAAVASEPPPITVLGGSAALPGAVTDQLGACAPGGVRRVAGAGRAATAAALSADAFPDGASTAFVASGHAFADALAAGPAAARLGAPLLLADRGGVPAATMEELRRLGPDWIVVVGGPAVLSEGVVTQLSAVAPVRRVAGPDRFGTAAALSPPAAPTVWVATGADWADALSAGPAAARDGAPILLVTRTEVPGATRDALTHLAPTQIVVVGGGAAVSDPVLDELRAISGADVVRVAGPDRFATAAAVADRSFPAADAVLLATGGAPADALAAVPVAVRRGAPLLLVSGPSLPVATTQTLRRLGAISCRQVTLEAGPQERLALGGPVLLAATGPTGTVTVGTSPGRLLLPGPAELQLAYPAPASGGPPVTWTQEVPASAERVVISQPWRGTRPPAPGGITLAWHAGASWDRYRDELAAAPGLTVSAPVTMHLDAGGALVGGIDPGFVTDARTRGVAVWATVASLDAAAIRAAVADPGRRATLASQVSERARAAGALGVNIDLEGWHHAETEAVTDLCRQITAHVRGWGGVTSIDLVSMSDTWATPPTSQYGFWSTAPQRRELSEAVDYVILMAYDEHNRLRPAGPVASPRWVEEVVRYQLRFTDPDRLVLGVPLYGRLWDPRSIDRPKAIPIGRVSALVAQGRRTPDPARGVDRVDLADGTFLWAEDHAALGHRTALVQQLGLAGTASWRLGFDDPSVWRVLAPYS